MSPSDCHVVATHGLKWLKAVYADSMRLQQLSQRFSKSFMERSCVASRQLAPTPTHFRPLGWNEVDGSPGVLEFRRRHWLFVTGHLRYGV